MKGAIKIEDGLCSVGVDCVGVGKIMLGKSIGMHDVLVKLSNKTVIILEPAQARDIAKDLNEMATRADTMRAAEKGEVDA